MKKRQTGTMGALTCKQRTIHACHEQINSYLVNQPISWHLRRKTERTQTGITQPQKGTELWPFAEMWMDLEPIIRVRQKEKTPNTMY